MIDVAKWRARIRGDEAPVPTRFEVIDETGRVYVRHHVTVTLDYQDEGRTLKVFIIPKKAAV